MRASFFLAFSLVLCLVVGSYSQATKNTYDFIIVGAGSAGSVVAGELADTCRRCSILVIEAGGDATDPKVHNTLLQGELFTDNYAFLRDDQTTIPAANYYGHQILVNRGKMTGGSFGINAMYHVPGHPGTWDQTAAEIGDNSWNWANTNRYRNQIPRDFDLITYDITQAGGRQFVNAIKSIGYNYDTNFADGQNGIVPSQQIGRLNPDRPGGIRETSWDVKVVEPGFLNSNIQYLTFHRVSKVLINAQKVATGVQVINLRSGENYTYNATKEVILSAGTFRTPQILMLSGVGPAAHLQSLGIPVIADLPVGNHLNDHVGIQTFWEALVVGSITPFLYATPNFQFFGPEKVSSPSYQMELSSNFASVYPDKFPLEGTVRLASRDPLANPIIDYNLNSTHEDAVLWGVKNLLFPAVTAIRAQGAWGQGFTPVQPGASDDVIRQYCRTSLTTNYHPLGTCRVGAANDATSVVDPRFRVRGISHLRVVDASVHRVLPAGNINSPTLLLGYFGADVIAEDNRL